MSKPQSVPAGNATAFGPGSPVVCITADAHIGQFMMDWTEYLDPKFRKEYQQQRDFLATFAAPGEPVDVGKLLQTINPGSDVFNPISVILQPEAVKRQHEERAAFLEKHFGDRGQLTLLSTGGEGDPKRQLLELAADGTVAGICLPQTSPFGFGKPSAEKSRANAEAVARWVADYVSVAPDRHAGTFVIPLEAGVDACVAAIERGHKLGLRGGVMLDTNPELKGFPFYNQKWWDPIWAKCAELGVVVNVHAGAGQFPGLSGGEILWQIDVRWLNERPLRYFLCGGVFDRHPKLKVLFIETNAAYAVEQLAMLDAVVSGDSRQFDAQARKIFHYTGKHDARDEDFHAHSMQRMKNMLKKKPSEYFESNVWLSITASADDWAAASKLGTHKLLWGSDYPHNEATWPTSMPEVRKSIAKCGIADADVRRIMGGNAAELWGFDLAKLQPIADNVGPVLC